MGFVCLLIVVTCALLTKLIYRGGPEQVYFAVGGVILLASVVFLREPFVEFALILVYLVSPLPMVLGVRWSAAIAALLIGNCLVSMVWISDFKLPPRKSFYLPLLLGATAAFSAVYGVARGNQLA